MKKNRNKFSSKIIVLAFALVSPFIFAFLEKKQEQKPISLGQFNKIVADKNTKVLVYFNASWCTVCAKMKPVMEQIEAEYKSGLQIVRIDTDRDKEVAKEFEVDALPVLMLYHYGSRQWTHVGLIEKVKLKNKIDSY